MAFLVFGGVSLLFAIWVFWALITGEIGARGGSSSRDKQPLQFWIGVVFGTVMALGCLVGAVTALVAPEVFDRKARGRKPPDSSSKDKGTERPAEKNEGEKQPDKAGKTADPSAYESQLPGAKGPVFEAVGKSTPEVSGGDVTAKLSLLPGTTPKARVIASGAKEVFVLLQFAGDQERRKVAIDLHNHKGQVKVAPGASLRQSDPATGKLMLHMPLKSTSGAFEDGPYQARVQLDGKEVARINWWVGKAQ